MVFVELVSHPRFPLVSFSRCGWRLFSMSFFFSYQLLCCLLHCELAVGASRSVNWAGIDFWVWHDMYIVHLCTQDLVHVANGKW